LLGVDVLQNPQDDCLLFQDVFKHQQRPDGKGGVVGENTPDPLGQFLRFEFDVHDFCG
jgi:hypothetical protein